MSELASGAMARRFFIELLVCSTNMMGNRYILVLVFKAVTSSGNAFQVVSKARRRLES
jgi:hypothetical protein